MTLFDISVPLSESLPTYEGDPPISIVLAKAMARGDIADVRSLNAGIHSGTHMDAPAHFIPGGRTIDDIDLDVCFGPAQVIDLSTEEITTVGEKQLATAFRPGMTRVLLKTRNSSLWQRHEFDRTFVGLAPDGAQFLINNGVRLVGIDYLSIAPFTDPATVHHLLLGNGVLIVEGLDLARVTAGEYTLASFPLRIAGAEAAPVRAVLMG
jgi:arylformamidase